MKVIPIEEINYESRINDVNQNKPKKGYLIYCMIIAAFGSSFNYGFSVGLYNTPYQVIFDFCNEVYNERYGVDITSSEFATIHSLINGFMLLGGIVGSFFSGFFADVFGRKGGIYVTNSLVIITSILNGSSEYLRSHEILILSRFITGIYCGIFSGILPLYLNELPPRNLRGITGGLNQLSIVLGILTSNILGLPYMLGTSTLWPVLVSLTGIPCCTNLIGLLFAVESPKFLYNSGKKEKTLEVLIKLRGCEKIANEEIEELEEEFIQTKDRKEIAWMDFLKIRSLRIPLLISIFIKVAQFFSGINAVTFYSTSIFMNAGLKGSWPTNVTIILGVMQVFMTTVCMAVIERAGRRVLIIFSCVGMSLFAFTLAISRIYGNDDRQWLYIITVVAAIGYYIFYSVGLGPLSWIIVAELFESAASGRANSIASFFSWTANFIVTISFPFLETAIHSYSFVIFGVLLLIISTLSFFFIPETKNKTPKEILAYFDK